MNNHILNYFNLIPELVEKIDKTQISKAVDLLSSVKKRKGRIFLLGVGGSAGNCSHAVNDFRKICEIETYTPTDNVSELTARINDGRIADTGINPSPIMAETVKIAKNKPKSQILWASTRELFNIFQSENTILVKNGRKQTLKLQKC